MFLILWGLLLLSMLASLGWVIACIFWSALVLNFLGGSWLMFIFLLVAAGATLVGGSAVLLVEFTAREKRNREAERAQLVSERIQLAEEKVRLAAERKQAFAELDAKDAELEAKETKQLEAQRVEEAKTAAKIAELDAREAKADARETEAETRRTKAEARAAEADARLAELKVLSNHLTMERRRFTVWSKRLGSEKAKLEAKLVGLKAEHGETFPEGLGEALLDEFFGALVDEDRPLMEGMFSNPFGLTATPKPIKVPEENKIDNVLERGREAKVISEEELLEVRCPISHQVMQDPVMGEDGQVYDRPCLRPLYTMLFGDELATYPLTRKLLKADPDDLPRHEVIYQKIQSLVQRCQVQLASLPEAAVEAREESAPTVSMGMV